MSQIGFGALLPLLLVLTGGWLLLRSRYCQPFIWWQSGYNLYFRVALAGILCLVPGLIVATIFIGFGLVESSCDNGDANVLFSFQCQQETFTLADWLNLWVDAVSFAAWLLGLLVGALANFGPRKTAHSLKINRRKLFRGKDSRVTSKRPWKNILFS